MFVTKADLYEEKNKQKQNKNFVRPKKQNNFRKPEKQTKILFFLFFFLLFALQSMCLATNRRPKSAIFGERERKVFFGKSGFLLGKSNFPKEKSQRFPKMSPIQCKKFCLGGGFSSSPGIPRVF